MEKRERKLPRNLDYYIIEQKIIMLTTTQMEMGIVVGEGQKFPTTGFYIYRYNNNNKKWPGNI